MAKCYVVSGVKVKCSYGTVETPLKVLPNRRVKAKGKAKANIFDCKPILNVGPFGVCSISKLPCIPVCSKWSDGKMTVLVEGAPALQHPSYALCAAGGGILQLLGDGQIT